MYFLVDAILIVLNTNFYCQNIIKYMFPDLTWKYITGMLLLLCFIYSTPCFALAGKALGVYSEVASMKVLFLLSFCLFILSALSPFITASSSHCFGAALSVSGKHLKASHRKGSSWLFCYLLPLTAGCNLEPFHP